MKRKRKFFRSTPSDSCGCLWGIPYKARLPEQVWFPIRLGTTRSTPPRASLGINLPINTRPTGSNIMEPLRKGGHCHKEKSLKVLIRASGLINFHWFLHLPLLGLSPREESILSFKGFLDMKSPASAIQPPRRRFQEFAAQETFIAVGHQRFLQMSRKSATAKKSKGQKSVRQL